MKVRADEDPYVHCALFTRVSEGLIGMCQEYCGTDDYDLWCQALSSTPEPDQYELFSNQSPEPVRVVSLPEPVVAPARARLRGGGNSRNQTGLGPSYWQASREARLLRLCEELLELDHPDIDTSWYVKRLNELRAEINAEQNARSQGV